MAMKPLVCVPWKQEHYIRTVHSEIRLMQRQ